MSNPTGDYNTFAGLGFTGLRFYQDGSQYIGYLYYGQDSSTPISGATYSDATGIVTFSASESPAGVTDLNFTGTIILDMSGKVTAIAGPWTGRVVNVPVAVAPAAAAAAPAAPAAAAPAAAAPAEPAIKKIGPIIPIFHVQGMWAALNRQDIIP
jgi:hypothetical protein